MLITFFGNIFLGCYCLLERIEKEQRLMAPLMMMTIMTAMMRLEEEQMVKPHQRRLAAAEKLLFRFVEMNNLNSTGPEKDLNF